MRRKHWYEIRVPSEDKEIEVEECAKHKDG